VCFILECVSKTNATDAITTKMTVRKMPIATPPAISSLLLLSTKNKYASAPIINPIMIIAQYLIFLTAFPKT
jgi:hypothetical protein